MHGLVEVSYKQRVRKFSPPVKYRKQCSFGEEDLTDLESSILFGFPVQLT